MHSIIYNLNINVVIAFTIDIYVFCTLIFIQVKICRKWYDDYMCTINAAYISGVLSFSIKTENSCLFK